MPVCSARRKVGQIGRPRGGGGEGGVKGRGGVERGVWDLNKQGSPYRNSSRTLLLLVLL